MNKNKYLFSNHGLKAAFSLIELSIVVLIIGILIAGVTQGSRLVTQSRLKVASNQTQNSVVASIPNLVTWLETASENSVNSATNGLNPENGDSISAWNDINPQSATKVIASNNSNQPTYVTKGINGLPSLQFSGSQYLLSTIAGGGNTPLRAGTINFTFVAVWAKTNGLATTGDIFDQGGTTIVTGNRAGFITGVGSNGYGFVGQSNDFSTAATYTRNTNIASIMTVSSAGSSNTTVTIYDSISSTPITGTANGNITTAGLSNASFAVGTNARTQTETFAGLISEIIIFDRVLKVSEINSIKFYLSQKYGITMVGAAQ